MFKWSGWNKYTRNKLNQIANGSGGGDGSGGSSGILIMNANTDPETGTLTLDKTWQEIHDADFAVAKNEYPYDDHIINMWMFVVNSHVVNGIYAVRVSGANPESDNMVLMTFNTNSPDGYPSVRM